MHRLIATYQLQQARRFTEAIREVVVWGNTQLRGRSKQEIELQCNIHIEHIRQLLHDETAKYVVKMQTEKEWRDQAIRQHYE